MVVGKNYCGKKPKQINTVWVSKIAHGNKILCECCI